MDNDTLWKGKGDKQNRHIRFCLLIGTRMCGIVGFIGKEEAAPILLDGLARLEYRGYDSAGVAVFDGKRLKVAKAKGRLQVLSDMIQAGAAIHGTLGIGHTRWATHGAPSDVNSHPQVSRSGRIAVVHNGIIENYAELKDFLIGQGVPFASETDTEVVAQLIEYFMTEISSRLWAGCFTVFREPMP